MSAYRETDKASKDNKETNEVKGFMQTLGYIDPVKQLK